MPKWNESAVGWMPESTRGRAPPVPCTDAETSGAVVVDMGVILTHADSHSSIRGDPL
ncbi:hypothetical protein GCM10023146_30000 [Nocardioides caricicola]